MNREVILIDGFYDDPYKVWDLARRLPYTDEPGGHHFARTEKSYLPENAIELFSHLVGEQVDPEPHFMPEQMFEPNNFNGSFYKVPPGKKAPTHVHHDQQEWVGVLSITPPEDIATCDSGTGLFMHKDTRQTATNVRLPLEEDPFCAYENNETDWVDWEMHTYVGNIFNRLMLYRADMFHAARIEPEHHEKRLSQLFCFSTYGWTGLRDEKTHNPEYHVNVRVRNDGAK